MDLAFFLRIILLTEDILSRLRLFYHYRAFPKSYGTARQMFRQETFFPLQWG